MAHHRRYNQVAEEVAAETGTWFLDNYATLADRPELFRDTFHYTVDGVRQLAGHYADFLAPKLSAD